MTYREILSGIAIGLTFAAYVPYIRAIHAGIIKPHIFSWILWGVTTLIVFFAQLSGGGGVGAWPIGASGLITLYVALLAFLKRGDVLVTRGDWLFFAAALSSLPLWWLVSDPLAAVVVLTGVDVLGFGPTFRKAYRKPFEEGLWFFAILALRNVLSALALEHFSATTLLFPVTVAVVCVAFLAMALERRRVLSAEREG